MGRSVSYANGSLLVAFTELDWVEGAFDFDLFLEDVRERACDLWPSFCPCDTWLGREDHAIAENGLGYIGVSEYCGVASIWFAPKPNDWNYSETRNREALATGFAKRIAPTFYATFGTLRRIGVVSNGEAIYERVA